MSSKWQKGMVTLAMLALALFISGCDLFGSTPAPTPPPQPTASGTPTKGAAATNTAGSGPTNTPVTASNTPTGGTPSAKTLKVGIIETVNQPALVAATDGAKQAFKD